MGSTIALAEAAGIEAGFLPAGWEIKVVGGSADVDAPAPAAQLISSDAKTGEVTAIVGVTGIVDHVGDLIEPGAYAQTLKKRRPKVCWAHSWELPIGKVLRIEEWAPGDPRFAKVGATLDGKAWPAEAGALVAHMQLNLKSERGKEAFAAVEFYSETGECEWSIGWQPIPTQTKKRQDGVRVCKKVELFEVSPVLFGAAPLTRTLEVKALNLHSATPRGVAPRVGQPAGDPTDEQPDPANPGAPLNEAAPQPGEADPVDEATLHRNAMGEIDWTEVDRATDLTSGPPGPGTPAAAANPAAQPAVDENGDEEVGEPTDDETAEGDPAPAGAGEGEQTARTSSPDDGDGADDETDPADAEDDKDPKKKKKPGLAPPFAKKSGGGFVLDAKSLSSFTGLLDLAADGVLLPDIEIKAEGGADQNRGNAEQLRHWYVEGGGAAEIAWGTPGDFDRCVAIAGKHMDPERAKGYCNLRHKDALGIYPATHAAADRAAEGKSAGRLAAELLAKSWNPLLEVGTYAAHGNVEQKFYAEGVDGLKGSFEQRQEQLRRGIEPILKDEIGWKPPKRGDHGDGMACAPSDCYVSIDGTWPDRVVATVVTYGEDRDKRTFVVPYTFDGDEVAFGKPQAVELQVSIVPAPGKDKPKDADELFAGVTDDDDLMPDLGDVMMLPAINLLDTGVGAIKSALTHSPEVKAGRVLSEANASRLRGALEHLLEVARSAGIDLPGWTGKDGDAADDGAMPDTTAPDDGVRLPVGGAPTAVKVLSPAELAQQLREFTL